MDQRADKRFRVTAQKDIARLFKTGRRASDGAITLYAVANGSTDGRCRAGVAVSKRHGNAVARNRIKRLCREAFRLARAELAGGWDFMIIPRVGADLTTAGVGRSIRSLAGRLTRPGMARPGMTRRRRK